MLPQQIRVIQVVYNTLVLPLFEYGDIVWADKNKTTVMDHFQIFQNKAAEIILDANPQSLASAALETMDWKPLNLDRF